MTNRALVMATVAAAWMGLASGARAANATWVGGTSGAWNLNANWNPNTTFPNGSGQTGTFNSASANTTLTVPTSITLSAFIFNTADAAAYTFNGGNFILGGAGTIAISNSVANNQTINSALQLGGNGGAATYNLLNESLSADLFVTGVITGGSGSAGAKVLAVAGAGDVAISGPISRGGATSLALTKGGGGTLTLSASNAYNGATTVNAGALNLAHAFAAYASTVTMNGGGLSFDVSVSPPAFTIGGLAAASTGAGYDIALTDTGANNVALTVGSNNASTVYAGALSGGGSLNKVGSGTLTLAGASTFGGLATVSAGALVASNALALGSTAAGAVVANNARLELAGDIKISGETATLDGGGGNFFGALQSRSGTNIWEGPVTIANANTRIGARTGSQLEVDGVIGSTGPHGIMFRPEDMSASVVLSAANTYTGETALVGGVVKLSKGSNRLPVDTKLNFGLSNVSAVFDLNGWTQEVAGLSVVSGANNAITNGAVMPSLLAVNTAAGSTSTYSAAISGPLSLDKLGSGVLTLNGATAYSGQTAVSNGTLNVNGAYTGGGTFTVYSGGTLGGTGSVGSLTLATGGILAPGNSAGLITVNGAMDAQAGSFLNLELASTSQYDRVVGITSLTINGTVQVTLLDSFVPQPGDTFNLLDFAGTIAGSYSLDLPSLTGGNTWDQSTFTSDGALTVIPEPATLGLLLSGLLLAGRLRRRRG